MELLLSVTIEVETDLTDQERANLVDCARDSLDCWGVTNVELEEVK
jgi:hypothetical protein